MGKKVVGITIAAGVGLGLGYLGYKYGRQFLTYLKKRDDRQSINDIAEDIKATLKKNMDELCKKHNEDDIKIEGVTSEKSLSEYLEKIKNFKVNKDADGKHVLSEDKAEKNLDIEINLKDEEEVGDKKFESVEDLNKKCDDFIAKMNEETEKVLNVLRARRDELAKEEDKKVVSEENVEKKTTAKKSSVKKTIKVEDGDKKVDSNKKGAKKASDKKTDETAE